MEGFEHGLIEEREWEEKRKGVVCYVCCWGKDGFEIEPKIRLHYGVRDAARCRVWCLYIAWATGDVSGCV